MLILFSLIKKISQCDHFKARITILFNRVAILILLYSGIVSFLTGTEIGIFGGLFHSTAITPSFDLSIYIIAPSSEGEGTIIYFFTAFYGRRIVQPIFPYNRFGPANGVFPKGYVKPYRNAVMCISVITLLYFLSQELSMYSGLSHFTTIIQSFYYITSAMLEPGYNGELFQDCLNYFTTMAVSPIIIYSKPEEQKKQILKENKGKSGVYR